MGLDNDTRGWIMTAVSGIACCFGASIICVDLVVRQLPRMHDFSISKSDTFLSASLSLSFGVMLFSSLYSMLPQSKAYLIEGGYSPRKASFMLIGLFLVGVVVIRVVSAALHRFIPSHVVDCDHGHDDERGGEEAMVESRQHGEHTPLLLNQESGIQQPKQRTGDRENQQDVNDRRTAGFGRTLSRTYTKFIQGQKENCDEMGPCKGFTDPCGQDCFKAVQRRISANEPWSDGFTRQSTWSKVGISQPVSEMEEEPNEDDAPASPDISRWRDTVRAEQNPRIARSRSVTHHHHHLDNDHSISAAKRSASVASNGPSEGAEHHHHVPTNAFMSIGLQTSIAIALHKAPEGFITYATNHANPSLGFAVFMALFIHNITEGFAMSLPLYLALNSRLKAIVWSSFLGGVSQPIGAGVAALWFRLAQHSTNGGPDQGVYGGMFAVTAGIMTSVALSLFSESLQLSHNKGICIIFAFVGMGVLGLSSALTAE